MLTASRLLLVLALALSDACRPLLLTSCYTLFACSGIKREHLFITSKIHPRSHGYWSALEVGGWVGAHTGCGGGWVGEHTGCGRQFWGRQADAPAGQGSALSAPAMQRLQLLRTHAHAPLDDSRT